MDKPWAGEFPIDDASDMDDAAVSILTENMRMGRADAPIAHSCVSELTTDGHGAYCIVCGETLA